MSFKLVLSTAMICHVAADIPSLDDGGAIRSLVAEAQARFPDAEAVGIMSAVTLDRFLEDSIVRRADRTLAATAPRQFLIVSTQDGGTIANWPTLLAPFAVERALAMGSDALAKLRIGPHLAKGVTFKAKPLAA